MTRSARDIVDSHLANTPTNPDTHPSATEPKDDQGPVGLYDYPPEDVRSREYTTGRRQSRSTERNLQYREMRASEEQKRHKSNDTRARNTALRARVRDPTDQPGQNGGGPEGEAATSSDPTATHRRGRSTTIRPLSRSPTPGSTDHKCDRPTQVPGESQYTYVYETLNHEGLVKFAQETFGLDVGGCDTQTIIHKLRVAEAQQASQVGPSRRPPSIVVLSPTPLQVGGGWSQDVLNKPLSVGPSRKRPSDDANPSGGSSKRQRTATAPDDTATESESDDEPLIITKVSTSKAAKDVVVLDSSGTESKASDEPTKDNETFVCTTAEHIIRGCSGLVPGPNLGPHPPPNRGTRPPPPTREATAATVLEGRPSGTSFTARPSNTSSPSLGDPIPPSKIVPPSLLSQLRGPVHSRLRGELLRRYLEEADREAQAAEADHAQASAATSDVDEVPETTFDSTSNASQHATDGSTPKSTPIPRTYVGPRSHISSQPTTCVTEPANTETLANKDDASVDPPIRPNSPSLTPSQLIRRERARALAARAHAEAADEHRHPHLFAVASHPPISRSQPRPSTGETRNTVRQHMGEPRRLDPISAARTDMLAFNQAVAQGEATSFVESVTRQSERMPRCMPPASRPRDDLLEDDEEMLAQAEAYTKLKWPKRPTRIRKPKPLARDVSGIRRQVLIMAKLHLFAYALVEGIYQTRATFLRWAAAVHIATWQMELPGQPYMKPDDDIFEIMVNNLATLRGKVKERMREFVATVSGFHQRLRNQQIIQENLDRFNKLYPNSFHCQSSNPHGGDYEHPEIGHCIALALFHSSSAVGVIFPDYFLDMPLTAVAFALAIWQFCLEEWVNGWRQNCDLGMGAMRDKYEAQLAGLKELRDVAPRRMNRLQNEWRDYVAEYSGAVFIPECENVEPLRRSQMRPDTPEPNVDAITVEEMNRNLLETARQASLRDQMEFIAAQELAMDMGAADDVEMGEPEELHAPTRCSRSPSPLPAEYNEHGIQTASSKGKGHS
ncbi:Formin-like protein 20 [Ceratobasidium theobromae]|uniref:Formin-like protein 20 n=1 Tax=Ceratobasidium theobromae TaxID=1582974 RepID=A0A5N5Q925_9AGAM|nr:Formin-like protein 20 [Ceratobasidium theobromae]